MTLAEISIRRPTLMVSIVLAIMVVGAICLTRIGVDMFPDITIPAVSIMTPYRGAGPEEIETLITKPLEDEVSSCSGLDHLMSINQEGLSVVVAMFKLDVDVRRAEEQVREKLALARPKFPKEASEPILRRFDFSDQPVMILALAADLPPAGLYDLAREDIKNRIEQVRDVGLVEIVGGTRREIDVDLDRARLKAHGLSLTGVAGRIAASSMNVPVGKFERGDRETAFRSMGEYRNLDQVRKVVANFFGSDVSVTVGDLGAVKDTVATPTSLGSFNGRPSVILNVYRQSGANTVAVTEGVAKVIERFNREAAGREGKPQLGVILNYGQFIRWNIEDVRNTILEGILLAILVVYLFLGSARSTFITAVALPNSILGAFALIYLMGFTFNMITGMAFSLAVGLLIDDAIVVRENIWRHLEEGKSPREAAIRGTREVTMAVIATTLAIIAVFLPMGFLGGLVGRFLKQLGFTVVFAMVVSLFDAMTMAPLLSAYLARKDDHRKTGRRAVGPFRRAVDLLVYPVQAVARWFDGVMNGLVNAYEAVIRWILSHRLVSLAGAALIFLLSIVLLKFIRIEFRGHPDNGFYQVTLEAEPGTSLKAMDRMSRRVEEQLRKYPETAMVSRLVGNAQGEPNVAMIFVNMVPFRSRKRTTSAMKEVVRQSLTPLTASLRPKVGDYDPVGYQAPFTMNVYGQDLVAVAKVAEEVKRRFAKIPGMVDADTNFRPGKPELQVALDPERMRKLGVSTVTAGMELRGMVDGVVPATFREAGLEYDIRVRVQPDQRDLAEDWERFYVPNMNFNLVPLAHVASPRPAQAPAKIYRQNRARYVQVSGDIGATAGLGNVVAEAKKIMAGMKLPPGVRYEFIGQSEDLAELVRNIVIAMILAVLFM